MKNERTISYQLSQKMTNEELESVSAAGFTSKGTMQTTYSTAGDDVAYDIETDYL